MGKGTRFVGLDVHAETIAASIAEPDGEVRRLGTIPNTPTAVSRLVKKLAPSKQLKVCYEAGPTGYALYWQLTRMGVECAVVAPTLVPVKAGDRVKTDRRDADKLAKAFRAGDLTSVWVPDEEHEALRDLVRAREAATKDRLRARHRLQKLLLRNGHRASGMTAWAGPYMAWVKAITFAEIARQHTLEDYLAEVEHQDERIRRLERAIDAAVEKAPERMRDVIAALQALRGVAKMSAVTIVAELGELSRFEKPRQLMGYSGAVPSECSSGGKTRRGAITKTGNAHLRRILIESAWSYRHRPSLVGALRRRQEGLDEQVRAIGWKAQQRLHDKYRRMASRSKVKQKIVTAVGRELLGFIWAIGVHVERLHSNGQHRPKRAA